MPRLWGGQKLNKLWDHSRQIVTSFLRWLWREGIRSTDSSRRDLALRVSSLVMDPQVPGEGAPLDEGLVALIALMRLLPRVSATVINQPPFRNKIHCTIITTKRTLSRVRATVLYQEGLGWISLEAYFTHKRLDAVMDEHVASEVGPREESEATDLAHEPPLLVPEHVGCQIVVGNKLFVAYLAFIAFLSVFCVGIHMILKYC